MFIGDGADYPGEFGKIIVCKLELTEGIAELGVKPRGDDYKFRAVPVHSVNQIIGKCIFHDFRVT
jgi:hypothetical protein